MLTRQPGVGTSRFSGFDQTRVDHLLSFCEVMPEDSRPTTDVLHDCVYVPHRHALYTTAGVRIDSTGPAYLEPDIPVPPSQLEKLARENDEKCPGVVDIPGTLELCETPMLLFGSVIPHFGHFLTDSMARLWALDDHPTDIPALCIGPVRQFSRSYERIVIETLGLGRRLISPINPTLFKTVICPRPAIQLGRRVYRTFDRPHRRVGEALGGISAQRPAGPVYLSRGRLGSGHRQLHGEADLEHRLEREGFQILHPEALPFEDQVALFQREAPVVGVIGSAFHTALFRNHGLHGRCALLSDDYVHQRFLLQDAVKPGVSDYLCCMRHRDRAQMHAPLQAQEFVLDVARAMDLLATAGLLRG